MKHKLPELPYDRNALEPYMSAETLEYHHDRHHRAYVDKLNQLIRSTEFEDMSLEEIIVNASGPIFNNAAQDWNHTFFWQSLTPQGRPPQGDLLRQIEKDFGSFEIFKDKFTKAASELFGSGWTWLVRNDPTGSLSIENTGNADNPIRTGKMPLLTCDVWEHAYYIDYRNERPRFVQAAWNLIDWDFAERNFAAPWELAA